MLMLGGKGFDHLKHQQITSCSVHNDRALFLIQYVTSSSSRKGTPVIITEVMHKKAFWM